jgi:hypothetical protein
VGFLYAIVHKTTGLAVPRRKYDEISQNLDWNESRETVRNKEKERGDTMRPGFAGLLQRTATRLKRTAVAGICAGALLQGAVSLGAVSAAMAGDTPVVVELFTSQGCSACPPADALLGELAKRSDVIPLALHVDYWDYIGWKDIFAKPEFTKRQKAYAYSRGRNMIYTPEMVIDGRKEVMGMREMEVAEAIIKARATPDLTRVILTRRGGKIEIRAEALVDLGGKVWVQLVSFTPQHVVRITRGENAGKTVTYNNIVTRWQRLRDWDGKAPLSLQVAADGEQSMVVLLQRPGPGMIVGAAILR